MISDNDSVFESTSTGQLALELFLGDLFMVVAVYLALQSQHTGAKLAAQASNIAVRRTLERQVSKVFQFDGGRYLGSEIAAGHDHIPCKCFRCHSLTRG